MKLALLLILVALTAVLAFPASPARAQIQLTEVDPPDGAQLETPPQMVHLCFSQPVIFGDNTTFSFRYVLPDGRSLGLRIVFQPGGQCVDVFPGFPDDYPAGEHTFRWQVTAAEGDEQGSGELQFRVTEGGTPVPSPSPPPTETPTAVTPSPTGGATPPPATPPAGETTASSGADSDGPDILLAALITIAAAGGAAVLFTLGYLLRRRIDFEPHRPPQGEEDEGGEH
jgi:methionine-rich copper-binding protein CopC